MHVVHLSVKALKHTLQSQNRKLGHICTVKSAATLKHTNLGPRSTHISLRMGNLHFLLQIAHQSNKNQTRHRLHLPEMPTQSQAHLKRVFLLGKKSSRGSQVCIFHLDLPRLQHHPINSTKASIQNKFDCHYGCLSRGTERHQNRV